VSAGEQEISIGGGAEEEGEEDETGAVGHSHHITSHHTVSHHIISYITALHHTTLNYTTPHHTTVSCHNTL
jgi:hypothetical protein